MNKAKTRLADSFLKDVEPIEQVEQAELSTCLAGILELIKDGDNRAIIRKYQAMNTDESTHNILCQLRNELQGGDDKGVVNGFIQRLNDI
jgi:hypothetical protein